MQALSGAFNTFRETIEPDKKRKQHAQKADDPVRTHLESHPSFSRYHISTFLYGSYRRYTAVGDIKDVDLVVVTNFTTNDNPVAVLDELKGSLAKLYANPQLADQRRSIRIDQPLPDVPSANLTLDVIPAIYQKSYVPDGPLWVPDRDKRCWVPSHPKGHIEFSSRLSQQSRLEHGFVRLAKMMKWWWKYQFETRKPRVASHERKPKGFWIEVMTGMFADLSQPSYPELIVVLLERAFQSFATFRTTGIIPDLLDPGLRDYDNPTYRFIKTSMTTSEFKFFLDILEESLGHARAALYATTEQEASQHWRAMFGSDFPLVENTNSGLLRPAVAAGGLSFPNQPITPRTPGGFA